MEVEEERDPCCWLVLRHRCYDGDVNLGIAERDGHDLIHAGLSTLEMFRKIIQYSILIISRIIRRVIQVLSMLVENMNKFSSRDEQYSFCCYSAVPSLLFMDIYTAVSIQL